MFSLLLEDALGEEKFSLALLRSLAGSENSTDKEKLIGERYTDLFKLYVIQKPSQGNEDLKKVRLLSIVMRGLMKREQSWRSVIGQQV